MTDTTTLARAVLGWCAEQRRLADAALPLAVDAILAVANGYLEAWENALMAQAQLLGLCDAAGDLTENGRRYAGGAE